MESGIKNLGVIHDCFAMDLESVEETNLVLGKTLRNFFMKERVLSDLMIEVLDEIEKG